MVGQGSAGPVCAIAPVALRAVCESPDQVLRSGSVSSITAAPFWVAHLPFALLLLHPVHRVDQRLLAVAHNGGEPAGRGERIAEIGGIRLG